PLPARPTPGAAAIDQGGFSNRVPMITLNLDLYTGLHTERTGMSAEHLNIDTTKPSIARVYDAFVGGKDNFEVDRQVLRKLLEIAPEAVEVGRQCRAWLIRVIRFLASEAGIDQF